MRYYYIFIRSFAYDGTVKMSELQTIDNWNEKQTYSFIVDLGIPVMSTASATVFPCRITMSTASINA